MIDLLAYDFVWRALVGGMAVALAAGPLGAFVIWRRMAYFGDTLSHSALLGVALGFLLGISLNLAIIGVCLVTALLMIGLQRQRQLRSDALLVILAHSALSLGLVAFAFQQDARVDIMGYLFGDILAIGERDLWWICLGAAATLILLALIWRPLLAITVDEDLARVEGVPVTAVSLAFTLLIALTIAVAMKLVGILLITSLLIIPAAAARRIAPTPEIMALFAALIGCLAVVAGTAVSMVLDTPTGPSIVLCAAAAFVLLQVAPARASRHQA